MLITARHELAWVGLQDRIHLAQADAPTCPVRALFHVSPRAELGAGVEGLGKGHIRPLYGDYARIAEVLR